MKQSENISEVCKALVKFQGMIQNISAEAINPHFGHKYADLGNILKAIREPLSKSGLAVIQTPEAEGAKVTIETIIMHETGQYISSSLPLTARDAQPQSIGSAITYGRRYGLSAMLGLATDEDDDGNGAQGSAGKPQQKAVNWNGQSQTQKNTPPAQSSANNTKPAPQPAKQNNAGNPSDGKSENFKAIVKMAKDQVLELINSGNFTAEDANFGIKNVMTCHRIPMPEGRQAGISDLRTQENIDEFVQKCLLLASKVKEAKEKQAQDQKAAEPDIDHTPLEVPSEGENA